MVGEDPLGHAPVIHGDTIQEVIIHVKANAQGEEGELLPHHALHVFLYGAELDLTCTDGESWTLASHLVLSCTLIPSGGHCWSYRKSFFVVVFLPLTVLNKHHHTNVTRLSHCVHSTQCTMMGFLPRFVDCGCSSIFTTERFRNERRDELSGPSAILSAVIPGTEPRHYSGQ